MFVITPAKEEDVTKLTCPGCRERFPRIGIKKDSKIEGLTFRCRRCHVLWELKTK